MAKTAAQSLYPHLPSAERPERAQSGPRLGDALWPSLTRKEPTWDERWWAERSKRDSESLLRALRELNAKHAREGR